MRKEKSFLASAEIAGRIGVIESRYRVPDGRYILSEKDLRAYRFSMTPEEFINGLDVEMLTDKQMQKLIRRSTLGIVNAQKDDNLVNTSTPTEPVEEYDEKVFEGNGEVIDILEEPVNEEAVEETASEGAAEVEVSEKETEEPAENEEGKINDNDEKGE